MSLYCSNVLLLSFAIFISTITALKSGNLGCFVDLSDQADRKTDVVVYYPNRTVRAFKQTKLNSVDENFNLYASFQTQEGDIQSISAMDFTKNGVADLFVVTENDGNYILTVWKDTKNSFTVSDDPQRIELIDKNVLILDANGDFIPDVFGKTNYAYDNGSEEQVEGFWFGEQQDKKTRFSKFKPFGIDANNILMETMSFIDLDQDCKADLVWMTKPSNGTSEIKMISGINFQSDPIPQSTHLITLLSSKNYQSRMFFADVNKDGVMDIIIPRKDSNELQLFLQNKGNSLDFKKLCSQTKTVQFKPNTGITLCIKNNENYLLKDGLPIIIQDINMDSEINIVAVLQDDIGKQKVFVSTIPQDAVGLQAPKMDRNSDIEEIFPIYSNENIIKDVAFFHSGEFPLGLHFLIQKIDDSLIWIHLESLLNDKGHGFLSICPLNNEPPIEKRYGGTMPGVTVKAFFRSRGGNKIFLSSGSLYQTNTKNHLLPFIVFGLGDPDSYIEKLVIGYSLYDKEYVYSQPGVPPNSQLVLFAYGDPWRLETFLAPYITPQVLAIIITVVMIFLGAIWLYLEIQERKSANSDQLKSGSTTANNFFF
eukprot:349093_1